MYRPAGSRRHLDSGLSQQRRDSPRAKSPVPQSAGVASTAIRIISAWTSRSSTGTRPRTCRLRVAVSRTSRGWRRSGATKPYPFATPRSPDRFAGFREAPDGPTRRATDVHDVVGARDDGCAGAPAFSACGNEQTRATSLRFRLLVQIGRRFSNVRHAHRVLPGELDIGDARQPPITALARGARNAHSNGT